MARWSRERICSALPEDSLRTGYRIEVSEDAEEGGDTAEEGEHVSEVGDAMLAEHKRLNVSQVIEDSATFARAFGGAALECRAFLAAQADHHDEGKDEQWSRGGDHEQDQALAQGCGMSRGV